MRNVRIALDTDGWRWTLLVDDEEIYRSADRFPSGAGAKWDARRRLAGGARHRDDTAFGPGSRREPRRVVKLPWEGRDLVKAIMAAVLLVAVTALVLDWVLAAVVHWLDAFLRNTINGS